MEMKQIGSKGKPIVPFHIKNKLKFFLWVFLFTPCAKDKIVFPDLIFFLFVGVPPHCYQAKLIQRQL
ncbi:TPA: hypothetical protein RKT19_003520 [Bacillus cereus]|nr:hypothetical protein [Bacillus cereus]